MPCEEEDCTATFVKVKWKSVPTAANVQQGMTNTKTGKKIDPQSAGIMMKNDVVDALKKELAKLNSVSVTSCGKLCFCVFTPPSDDDYEFKDYTVKVRMTFYAGRPDEVSYDVSWPALIAVVTCEGTCTGLSPGHWLYPKKKDIPLYEYASPGRRRSRLRRRRG